MIQAPPVMPYGSMAPQMQMPIAVNPQAQQNTTLYIGSLDKAITDNMFFSKFNRYGQIISYKIMHHRDTRESRGFAFVQYSNVKECEAARNHLNNEKWGNKYIRITWKDDHKKSDPKANLFIRNLDPKLTQNEVEQFFQQYGPVSTTFLSVNEKTGVSNGYAHVQFRSVEDADRCLEAAKDGVQIGDTTATVEKFKSRQERAADTEEIKRNIYIRNLPESVEEKDLRAQISGKITSLIINENPYPGEGNAKTKYAMIAFDKQSDAEEALNKLGDDSKKFFPGQTLPLYVSWAKTKLQMKEEKQKLKDQERELTLYLKNLLHTVTEPEVIEVLNKLGVTHQTLKLNKFTGSDENKPEEKYETQNAFIKLENKDQVQTVLNSKNSADVTKLFIGGKAYIDIALSKEVRERMKRTQKRKGGKNASHAPFAQARLPPPYPMGMAPMGGWQQAPFGGQMRQPMNMMRGGMPPMGGPQGRGGYIPRGGGRPGPMRMGGPAGGRQGPPPHYQQRQFSEGPMGGQRPQHPPAQQQMRQPMPQQMAQQPPRQAEQPQKIDLNNILGNWENFLKLSDDDRRNILGEFLFPKVEKLIGRQLAPKITGMLVDFEVMSEKEIVEAIQNEEVLKQRIEEAKEALEDAGDQ